MEMAPGEVGTLFPAYAGVILGCVKTAMNTTTFPRVCGGDPKDS